jgi:hypothetical protein
MVESLTLASHTLPSLPMKANDNNSSLIGVAASNDGPGWLGTDVDDGVPCDPQTTQSSKKPTNNTLRLALDKTRGVYLFI